MKLNYNYYDYFEFLIHFFETGEESLVYYNCAVICFDIYKTFLELSVF